MSEAAEAFIRSQRRRRRGPAAEPEAEQPAKKAPPLVTQGAHSAGGPPYRQATPDSLIREAARSGRLGASPFWRVG